MKFIATADWQLGMTAAFLGDEARARFKQARLEVIRRIGALAGERDAEFVLVCGDVFESNQLDRQVVARAFEALRDVPVPVFLLPGNHDPLDASSIYTSDAFVHGKPDHVHVLESSGVVEVRPGLEIVAAPWFTKRPLGDLVARACESLEPADGTIRVVAGHGAVDALDPDRDNQATIEVGALDRALADGRVQFVALGDRHSTTRVSDRIWYPGAPEVTARRELDPGNVLVVEVGDDAVGVEPVHLGEWQFIVRDQELNGGDDIDELDGWLAGRPAKERTAVWLRLTGTLSVSDKATLDDVLETHTLLFAALTLWQRHHDLAVRPDDTDFAELGLTGFAAEAVDELRQQSAGEDEAARSASDALGLLYRLAGAGR